MSDTRVRPLSPLERESVQPDNLARILHGAVKRLSYVEPTNVADVAAQLNQFAMRLDRLVAEMVPPQWRDYAGYYGNAEALERARAAGGFGV